MEEQFVISAIDDSNLERIKHDVLLHKVILESMSGDVVFLSKNMKYDRTLFRKGEINGKERFYDSYRKRLVSENSSGYVRAYKVWEFKRRYNPIPINGHGWYGKKNSKCKFRPVSVIDKAGHVRFYIECNVKETEYLSYIPVENLNKGPKARKVNIRYYYTKYNVPVDTLAQIFKLTKKRVYQIIKDVNPKSFSKNKRCILQNKSLKN